MLRRKRIGWFVAFLGTLAMSASSGQTAGIGGTISKTLTITEDSELVDDVTCVVNDAPCIAIGAPNVTLELNGFTMTGQADPQTACNGGGSGPEVGIGVDTQAGVAIHGPGLVQQFRGHGIRLVSSTGATITDVTISTNCFSGIFVSGGSDHHVHGNVAVRNGNRSNPCGGL